jgi:hypothetical protein
MRKKGLHLDSLVQKLFGWDLNPQIDALTERRFTIKLPKITPAPPLRDRQHRQKARIPGGIEPLGIHPIVFCHRFRRPVLEQGPNN